MRKPIPRIVEGVKAGPVIPPLEGLRSFAHTNPLYQVLVDGDQAGNIIIAKMKELLQEVKDGKKTMDEYDIEVKPWKDRHERLGKAKDDVDPKAVLAILEECKK